MNGGPPPQNQRGQGQLQYGQGNNRGPLPRDQGSQNVEIKEFHHFCEKWHAQGQDWSEGQGYGCSNYCAGNHPSDECCQPDKVISMPNPVANPQQQARDNMRGARPQGGFPNELRPPNFYYDHGNARQTFHPPVELQTANVYIPIYTQMTKYSIKMRR